MRSRRAFTLIELLVVIALIGVLAASCCPRCRRPARRPGARSAAAICRQFGLALHNYEGVFRVLPPSIQVMGYGNTADENGCWSIQARLLSFFEQSNLYKVCNFSFNKELPLNAVAIRQTIPFYICPERSSHRRLDPPLRACGRLELRLVHGGLVYLEWRQRAAEPHGVRARPVPPALGHHGRSEPNGLRLRGEDVPAGVCLRQRGLEPDQQPRKRSPAHADPVSVAPEYNGGCRLYLLGHTEWSDGNSHATGFTTAWPPNKVTLGAATGVDMDLNGINEEDGGPTFAAITSRSWHAGGVQSLMGDGSVPFYSSSIDGTIWRALGTVSGGDWANGLGGDGS